SNTKTPTKAAEFIITHNKAFEDKIQHFQKQIIIKTQSFLSKENKLFNNLQSQVLNNSRTILQQKKITLSTLENTFINSSKDEINVAKSLLDKSHYQLQSRPQSVLYFERNNLHAAISNLTIFSQHLLRVNNTSLKNAVA